MKTIQLTTMNVSVKQIASCSLYKGNRPVSKTDHLILLEFVRLVFDHNHICCRLERLQDHEIISLICEEFDDSRYADTKRNYVSVWRNMFNSDRLHHLTRIPRSYIAFRVNSRLQFTKSTSPTIPLSLRQLYELYSEQNFKLPQELINEVASYT